MITLRWILEAGGENERMMELDRCYVQRQVLLLLVSISIKCNEIDTKHGCY
jgi:hypothetical protein